MEVAGVIISEFKELWPRRALRIPPRRRERSAGKTIVLIWLDFSKIFVRESQHRRGIGELLIIRLWRLGSAITRSTSCTSSWLMALAKEEENVGFP